MYASQMSRVSRDRAIEDALAHPILLPELAAIVAGYDRRPAQRFCQDPDWLPEGVSVAEDGRSFWTFAQQIDFVYTSDRGMRGEHSFATGACRWRIRGPASAIVFAGVVDVSVAPDRPFSDYHNRQLAFVGMVPGTQFCPHTEMPKVKTGRIWPKEVSARSGEKGYDTIDFFANVEEGTLHAVFNDIFRPEQPLFTGLDLRRCAPYVGARQTTKPIIIESEDE